MKILFHYAVTAVTAIALVCMGYWFGREVTIWQMDATIAELKRNRDVYQKWWAEDHEEKYKLQRELAKKNGYEANNIEVQDSIEGGAGETQEAV